MTKIIKEMGDGSGIGEASLFSTANPLFFRISAMVTTVEIAVNIWKRLLIL